MLHLRRQTSFVFIICLLFVSLTPAHAADPSGTRRVASDIAQPEAWLASDGALLVWATTNQANRERRDLNAADLVTGQTFTLASAIWPSAVAVDAGIVAWAESSCPDCAESVVKIWRRHTGQVTAIAPLSSATAFVALAGRWLIYYGEAEAGIMGVDLTAGTTPVQLVAPEQAQTRSDRILVGLRAAGDLVVWELRGPRLFSDLAALRIGRPEVVSYGASGLVSWDLQGDALVYSSLHSEIVAINARTGQRTTLANETKGVTTDGRYVFWPKTRDVPSGPGTSITHRVGISAYDLSSASLFDFTYQDVDRSGTIMARAGSFFWERRREQNPEDATVDAYVAPTSQLLPSTRRERPAQSDVRYFPETGHTIGQPFLDFWTRHGGLAIFGYTITEPFTQTNRDTGEPLLTQYLERQRFEHHPQNRGTVYEVLLGRLGAEELQRQGRDWQTFPKADPSAAHYFAETGQAIAPEFWNYWQGHGLELGDPGVSYREALALFGYPLSPPRVETNSSGHTVLTQWFERACFEYHPQNAEPYKILLRRLASDKLSSQGW